MLRWNEESSQVQAAALMRPAVSVSAEVEAICKTILANVKEQGDEALLKNDPELMAQMEKTIDVLFPTWEYYNNLEI